MLICISDRDRTNLENESFLGGRFTVLSRSGLNPTETLVISSLNNIPSPEALLFLGNRTGVSGIIARELYPKATIVMHCLDLYHANKIERALSTHKVTSVAVRCKPYVEERSFFSAAFVQATRGGITGELLAELLQESHQGLVVGGRCFVSVEGKFRWVGSCMKRLFGSCSLPSRAKQGSCFISRKRQPLKKTKRYQAEFTMTMYGKTPVVLMTIPGVFSHRRVDQGAQALAEVVEVRNGDTILDMGCGCGVIGLSIAKNNKVGRVVFLDSNARATHITERNCQRNGLSDYEVILSDRGIDRPNAFTLFIGNPPYFTDYKIAELFIRTAHKTLVRGGRAYIVAKTASWHEQFMEQLFGNAETLKRRGYEIVKSSK